VHYDPGLNFDAVMPTAPRNCAHRQAAADSVLIAL
jgi:hypothetical protein